MPKLTWQVINVTQANNDITTYVRSMNFTFGRPTALSPYSGNSASITMSSYGGTELFVSVNDQIFIKATPTGGTQRTIFDGRVASRNYDDIPGSGVNSTMIVNINDTMLQAGMANFTNQALSSVNGQLNEIDTLLPQINFFGFNTTVDMSVGTFTVNANQRINEIIAGDRGVLKLLGGAEQYLRPLLFDNNVSSAFTVGRTTSATQIAYQDLVRIEGASNSLFNTSATITGSAATATSTAVEALVFGVRSFTATTAQSNLVTQTAEWYANAFTDYKQVMLDITFKDIAQNELALRLLNDWFADTKFVSCSYTPPGGVSTTGYFWPEQITFNAMIDHTVITMAMTPLAYYANFTLNDTVFGVLDTDRLGVV